MKTFTREDSVILCRQFVVVLIDLVKQSGILPDRILKGTHCFYQDLNKAEYCISINELLTIIDNTSRHRVRDDLSFILGKKFFPSQLGALEQAFLNSKNLGEMLKICQLFQFQLCPFVYLNIIKIGKQTHILINSAIGKVNPAQQRFISEFIITAILGAIKYCLGEAIPVTVKLPYNTVDYIEQYHTHFKGKIVFNQQLTMISVDNSWLTKTIPDCSQSLRRLALSEAKAIRGKKRYISLVQAVRELISKSLYKQHISLESCADYFTMSPATLKRKLAQHDTSYQLLLDELKCQQAIIAMIENKQNNESIATDLNFTDVTNFRRAFKRWTGMTPSDFRKTNLSNIS